MKASQLNSQGFNRDRWRYGLVFVAVGLAGLASRSFRAWLPPLLEKNTGDVLWALLVYFLVATLGARWSVARVATASLLFSLAVEVTKLIDVPFFTPFRHTKLGALFFGTTFSWTNLVCYGIGVGLGVAADYGVWRK